MADYTIIDAMDDRRLLGAGLGADLSTWETWRVALKAAFGLGLVSSREFELFAGISGGRAPPTRRCRELWILAGRRSGKSRIAALIACFIALFVKHNVAPGEVPVVQVVAASKDQAAIIFGYARGFLKASAVLEKEIVTATQSEIRLKNGCAISVAANSFRTSRGRTTVASLLDEVSFWRSDLSATPDLEVYSALLPGLATCNGLLVSISTAYRRSGLFFGKHRQYFGVEGDDTLVLQGASMTFNPTLNKAAIDAQRAADPVAAASEWDSVFRGDLSAFLDDNVLEGCIAYGRPLELPPRSEFEYSAFTDVSGGSGLDAYTVAIGHRETQKDGTRYIVDLVRGSKAGSRFDPAELTASYASLLKQYRISSVGGDKYSGEWAASAWGKAGITYVRSEAPKSTLYLECLPLFSRGAVELPNHARLLTEFRLLERCVHRSGKDTVDHGTAKGSHDDYANACAGVLYKLSATDAVAVAYWEALRKAVNDGPEEPPLPELHPQYRQYAEPPPYSPWLSYDMIRQHEQRAAAAVRDNPTAPPPPPSPELIRALFAQLAEENAES